MEKRPRLRRGERRRRWPGALEYREPVRPVFHHETGRLGDWAGAVPADRGGAWRLADARESDRRARVRGAPAPAVVAQDLPALAGRPRATEDAKLYEQIGRHGVGHF